MVQVGGLSETFDLYPPKAEATGSNPVGRANIFNDLAVVERFVAAALSAPCPRYPVRYPFRTVPCAEAAKVPKAAGLSKAIRRASEGPGEAFPQEIIVQRAPRA
jgi:hypothetical protein